MAVVIVLLLIIFAFVPLAYLNHNFIETENTKESLNLSAKALANSVEQISVNLDDLALGYSRDEDTYIRVDKEKLQREFYQILKANIMNEQKTAEVESSILIKVLACQDVFFIAGKGKDAVWSNPVFYKTTAIVDGYSRNIFLNTKNNKIYYYNNAGEKVQSSLEKCSVINGIACVDNDDKIRVKNDVIINMINTEVARYTYEPGIRNGLNIRIRNPKEENPEKIASTSYLNVLDGGVNFFVVYGENPVLSIQSKDFKFKNYNVVGFNIQ